MCLDYPKAHNYGGVVHQCIVCYGTTNSVEGVLVAGGFAEQIPKGPKYADFSGLWIITVNVVTKHALFTN